MEFRIRNYAAEEETYSLHRVPSDTHPLSAPTPSHQKVEAVVEEKSDFFDPLRSSDANLGDVTDIPVEEDDGYSLNEVNVQHLDKGWTTYKKFLLQRFSSGSKLVSVSAISDVIVRSGKVRDKSSTSAHLAELDDPTKFAEAGVKLISQQEYISRLHELKDEINRAWKADDRVTSLKLSIKVARLLADASVLEFYPTLFVLVTDVMDVVGDMVWQRIKRKAEFSEDGNLICSLPENFEAKDIRSDAKETCNNWFFKIGAVHELLPRIYMELALLPCWRFLTDSPTKVLKRLVMMTRGIADPVASAYCYLYMAHCAEKMPKHNTEYLMVCISDIKAVLTRLLSAKGDNLETSRMVISLMEPAIEYIIKCIIKDSNQAQVRNVLMVVGLGSEQSELNKLPCISIIVHHFLKELPVEIVCSFAIEILELIDCSKDHSLAQYLNYRLLGFRLTESRSPPNILDAVVDRVVQVACGYTSLDEYLKVMDAYIDIILQNQMDNHLNMILDGIMKLASKEGATEFELASLQSIITKFISHLDNLEDLFSLRHFVEILDLMHGSPRSMVNTLILTIATRSICRQDPATIQLLLEVSQSLHNDIDYSNRKSDDNQQRSRLISRFINMVDYGGEVERQLAFLVECRGTFGSINEVKETLVRSSNCLAVRALRDGQKLGFVKSCIAVSEVTIPSVPSCVRQLTLYLETAEVAVLGGLFSHLDGLLDSAIICLQTLDLVDGSRLSNDTDEIVAQIKKLCSLLVLVPGNPEQGVIRLPKTILELIDSLSWMTSNMRTRVLCAVITLAATISQCKLPYNPDNEKLQILSNDVLFFGDPAYLQELQSFSAYVVQILMDYIMREPSQVTRGIMALDACNCIASSFNLNDQVLPFFTKLMGTAELCLSADDKYLKSTVIFVDKFLPQKSC